MEDIQQPISGLLVSTLLFNNKSTRNLESKEPWHPQPPSASGISGFFEVLPLLLLFFTFSFELANLSINNWRFILSFISFGLLAPFLLEAGINWPWVWYRTSLFELNYVYLILSKYNTEYYKDYVYPSWIWFDTFNLDLRETLPSLSKSLQQVPGIYDQWDYFRTVWSIRGSWQLAGINSYRIFYQTILTEVWKSLCRHEKWNSIIKLWWIYVWLQLLVFLVLEDNDIRSRNSIIFYLLLNSFGFFVQSDWFLGQLDILNMWTNYWL